MALESIVVWIIIGAWLLSALNVSVGTGLVNDIVTASIGAIVLLVVIRLLRRI